MRFFSAAASSALMAGGLAIAGPAFAEDTPAVFGTYTFEAADGESATWNVRPCPDDAPGCARVAEFGNSKRAPWSADAHYTVGSWFLFVGQPDAVQCPNGTTAPGQITYSWDNATLSGNASVLTNGACGGDMKNLSIPFRLNKIGGPLAPAPETPPAPAAVPAAPPAPAAPEPAPVVPLPAESPAAS